MKGLVKGGYTKTKQNKIHKEKMPRPRFPRNKLGNVDLFTNVAVVVVCVCVDICFPYHLLEC